RVSAGLIRGQGRISQANASRHEPILLTRNQGTSATSDGLVVEIQASQVSGERIGRRKDLRVVRSAISSGSPNLESDNRIPATTRDPTGSERVADGSGRRASQRR